MFVTNRRFVVLLGFLFSTVFVAGVAGAEPESGPNARATVGGDGPEASSVSGGQYSDTGEDDASGGGGDNAGGEDRAPEDTRPPQDGEAGSEQGPPSSVAAPSTPSPETRAEAGGGSQQDARTNRTTRTQQSDSQQSDSRQSDSRQVSRQNRTRQSGSEDGGQRQQRSVSRESNGSGESAGPGESSASAGRSEARAAARTVQSPEIRSRVRELREKDRAGDLGPAATSDGKERRSRELRIAQEEIVAQPVDEASLRRYKELYEEAAEEYGFGDDWYVLAAVGEVESDHGQNMGPSSAGALGPMQFMPSTWDSYGLDANDDGKANIMDPEDAIPSAARYLKAGGAPDDWYEALYTYNHAGWYVEKVLKVAEGYRQAAGDEEVGPYYGDR